MKKYFLYDGTTQHGPFDLAELETKIITPQTMVWHESLTEWKPASEIDELKNHLNTKVPAAQILTPPVIKAREEDWSKKQYYYNDNNGQQGPFTLEQLKNRPINANTQVWYDPLPEWTTADKVPGLKEIIANATRSSTPAANHHDERIKKQYYYLDAAGQKQGPFTLEELNGKPINASTLIWYDPLPEWVKAGSEESLKNIIASSQPVQTTPVQQNKSYYYLDTAGQKQGPYTFEQLKGKQITATTLIWYEPLTEWIKAGTDESVKSIIASAQPVQHPAKRSYYYMDNGGQQQGPFTLEQLIGKPITAATLIWYDSLPQWVKAGSDESLKNIIANGANGIDWSKKLFYYTDGSGQQGPFTLEQLRTRPITAATPVWYDPLPQWTTAGQVEGLHGIIR